MLTALAIVLITSLVVGGALLVATSHYKYTWAQSRSESALLTAEGGLNDELAFIAANVGNASLSGISSQPTVQNSETQVYPGENHAVYGRKGTIPGQSNGWFWVCTSQNDWWGTGAAPVSWDGKTSSFWITSTAFENGSWRRVKAQSSGTSVFSLYAVFALANYTNSSNAVGLSAATVVINGTAGTNGSVSNSSSTLTATNILNANTAVQISGQFTSSNLASGGSLFTQTDRVTYPTTVNVLKKTFGQTGLSDADAWTWISTNNNNATGVYTFRKTASSTTVNTTNCQAVSSSIGTTLTNSGANLGSWAAAGASNKSGSTKDISGATNASPIEVTTKNPHGYNTGDVVFVSGITGNTAANGAWTITVTGSKTFTLGSSTGNGTYTNASNDGSDTATTATKVLIFEPGDYFFTQVQVGWSPYTLLVIDPLASASGGTPGPVRFWVYDPANGTQNDFVNVQVNTTSTDPSNFRLFYGKDGKQFQFARPSNVTDYLGNAITGDFSVYGGVYAVTKVPGDNLNGTTISFSGSTGVTGGYIFLQGSLLADSINFQGPCKITYTASSNSYDIAGAAGLSGGYSDGG